MSNNISHKSVLDTISAAIALLGSAANLAVVDTVVDAIKVVTDRLSAVNGFESYTQKVYPTLANAVSVASTTTGWLAGTKTEIVPVNTITTDFVITGIRNESGSADELGEIILYRGLAAAEVEIGRVRLSTGVKDFLPLNIKVAGNQRISAALATKNTTAITCGLSIQYINIA